MLKVLEKVSKKDGNMREEEIANEIMAFLVVEELPGNITINHADMVIRIAQALRAFGKEKYNEAIEESANLIMRGHSYYELDRDKDKAREEFAKEIRKLRKE